MNDINELTQNLNELLTGLDLTQVSSENNNFSELPDGYYLCEVEDAKLETSKSSGNLMVSFKFKIIENGFAGIIDDFGNFKLAEIPHTSNRKIFKHYPFPTQEKYKAFVSEMMRFEDDKDNQEILRSAFQTADLMLEALETLIERRIYVQVSTSEKNGNKSTFTNIISWKRAASLGLATM